MQNDISNSDKAKQVDENPKSYFVWYEQDWQHESDFHTHNKAQLVYVSEGFQHIHVNDSIYLVPQNHVIWIPANQPHMTKSSAATVNIMTLFFQMMDDKESFYNEVRVFAAPNVLKEMLFYAAKWSRKKSSSLEEHYFLQAILYELPNFWQKAIKLSLPAPNDARLIAVCAYLQEHYRNKLSYADLASEHALSQRTMERLFKSEFGITVSKYVQLIRIIKSIESLTSTQLSISEIANRVGYSGLQAFSNSFQQIMGLRPKEFAGTT